MQTFAVIPAAGRSRRMGQPKLLLPWGTRTVIEHVLDVWRASRVDRVIMVVHPADARLAELGQAAEAHVVQPLNPPGEMKESVRLALEFAARCAPLPSDAWLLAPADMPGLSTATIDSLIEAYAAARDKQTEVAPVWLPRHRGRRGHPVLFAWSLAAEVPKLAENEGLNALVDRERVEYVEAAEDTIWEDFDTPEDYERLRARHRA